MHNYFSQEEEKHTVKCNHHWALHKHINKCIGHLELVELITQWNRHINKMELLGEGIATNIKFIRLVHQQGIDIVLISREIFLRYFTPRWHQMLYLFLEGNSGCETTPRNQVDQTLGSSWPSN